MEVRGSISLNIPFRRARLIDVSEIDTPQVGARSYPLHDGEMALVIAPADLTIPEALNPVELGRRLNDEEWEVDLPTRSIGTTRTRPCASI